MDKIELRRTKIKYGADVHESDAINIFINGRNFLDDIHNYEKNNHIAGGHVPITDYELYESLAEDYLKKAVPIYGCGCGFINCCPVYISVKTDEKFVTWYNFEFDLTSVKEDEKFRALTFDKEQYFSEIAKLKEWIFGDLLKIEYGEIVCGFIRLRFKKKNYFCEITFDHLVNDPIPQLVNFFAQVRKGEDCEENFPDEWFETHLFSMSARHYRDKIFFTMQIYRYEHISEEDVVFEEIYFRDEFETMLKKIFDDLLRDEKFPYIYPMYHRYDDDSMDDAYDLACQMAKDMPDLTDEEKYEKEDELLLQMLKDGKVKLDDSYKSFMDKYRKMLTNYVVPEKWLIKRKILANNKNFW